jgi:hypothetical protein
MRNLNLYPPAYCYEGGYGFNPPMRNLNGCAFNFTFNMFFYFNLPSRNLERVLCGGLNFLKIKIK